MSVRVVARLRPLLKSEQERDLIVSASGAGDDGQPKTVRVPNPKNEGEYYSFRFNGVYTTEQTQQELFDGEVAPTVKHLFNGTDVTLFAYGVTGTGKTHTMRGGKSLAERGVIPRLLSAVYRRARKLERENTAAGGAKVEVSMSYYEIYNDRVYDLFEAPERRTTAGLALRDAGGKTVVVGLTERPCESLKEFEKLYDQANVNRSTSATKLNAHSSRSHAILRVKLTVTRDEKTTVSTASAIDLAGSEDNRRTDNSKERLVESSSINRSLFVLAQCVEAISKKAPRIPYRESKMTRILSLGQNHGITVMILNLAPVRSYHLDTLSSLNFANRTKKIEIREAENEAIVKGCARPIVLAPSVNREPLRALTSANHNAIVRKPESELKKPAAKSKAFAVFADQLSPAARRISAGSKKPSPLKRTSEHLPLGSRPMKRPAASALNEQESMSTVAIEQIVEKKVNAMLASKLLDQNVAAPAEAISDAVEKRLEALEQRAEAIDDIRTEGLSYILTAKQHQLRGEEFSALKMYELARDIFPENAKIEARIQKLRVKLEEEQQQVLLDENHNLEISEEQADPQSPRTTRLLSIINTRDIKSICELNGVGFKIAECIISALSTSNIYEIQSLQQLGELEGVGTRTVEDMRFGLVI